MKKGILLLAVWGSVVFMAGAVLALPPGSYQASCKNYTDDGTTLRCDCKNKKGQYQSTSLAYKICESGSISNDNGKLKCTPSGTFKRTCSDISWNESFLKANCKKIQKGQTLWNSGFNYNTCINGGLDIANCDGSLKCGTCN